MREHYVNRELSWLMFNERVLGEAGNPENPPLERARFLSIASGNLDEFFMVRVGKLERKADLGKSRRDPAGLTPTEQLALIRRRVRAQVRRQYALLERDVLPALGAQGLHLLRPGALSGAQRAWLSSFFDAHVLPLLTPHAVSPARPFPILAARKLYVAALVQGGGGTQGLAVIPVPRSVPRAVMLPMGSGKARFILLEDVVTLFLPRIFRDAAPLAHMAFRLTRNTDYSVSLDDMDNLLTELDRSVRRQSYGKVVRMETSGEGGGRLPGMLARALRLDTERVVRVNGPLDLRFLMREVCSLPGFDGLRYAPFTPRVSPRLLARESIFRTIRGGDLFFHHPYDSFDPVARFLSESADDPNVLAIKQTLYRVSPRSPMIGALARAAQAGKQVTALIEVRARFDEEHNIAWSRELEKAGCHVLYGVPRWKTHSKLTLVIRREAAGTRNYVHFGTGNYNDVTARVYTDMGVMTCDRQLGEDAAAFFNQILGYSYTHPMKEMVQAPDGLREAILSRIRREEDNARGGLPSGVTFKMNSLCDLRVMDALVSAAGAGVPVRLLVRGVCCLAPPEGLPIRVRSVVGRFLEHSRVYAFHNGGSPEVFLSSADMMPRNLNKRVELTVPVKDAAIRGHILSVLDLMFLDNRKAWEPAGGEGYRRVPGGEPAVNAQELLLLSPDPLLDNVLPQS